MILNARVKEVKGDEVVYTVKDPASGKMSEHRIDSGFTLWSTGIGASHLTRRKLIVSPSKELPLTSGRSVFWRDGVRTAMNPFTQRVASLLPNQYHKHALEVDSHLRVLGAPLGTVYALGDCSTIETRLVDHLLDFVERCDEDHDGNIDRREFAKMMTVSFFFPLLLAHALRGNRDVVLTAFLKCASFSTSSANSLPPKSTSTRSSRSPPLPHASPSVLSFAITPS